MPSTVPEKLSSAVHVAVGVIRDSAGNILITRRPDHAHQGGLWEFPGGKLEPGETVAEALARELYEEVGIQVERTRPLIEIRHDYGDRQVLLDVWDVNAYSGQETACEGQAMRWVSPQQLDELHFPAANLPIIRAAQLPKFYAILEGRNAAEVRVNFQRILQHGVELLQLRIKNLPVVDVPQIVTLVARRCRELQIRLMLNSDLHVEAEFGDGVHFTSRALAECQTRPSGFAWVAASCHDLQELQLAEKLGVDFVVLAPVQETATHPGAQPLGWETVSAMLAAVNIPVFLMGGLGRDDLGRALEAGAQGIAGISAFSAS
jgi:8-oxo-dGTP diphosphatase